MRNDIDSFIHKFTEDHRKAVRGRCDIEYTSTFDDSYAVEFAFLLNVSLIVHCWRPEASHPEFLSTHTDSAVYASSDMIFEQ